MLRGLAIICTTAFILNSAFAQNGGAIYEHAIIRFHPAEIFITMPNEPMKKLRYEKTMGLDVGLKHINDMAAEGWELMETEAEGSTAYHFILRRRKQ